jgi:hypothetical protein
VPQIEGFQTPMRGLRTGVAAALLLVAISGCAGTPSHSAAAAPWTFAVSGDSRNCGNIVMPAIAAAAKQDHAAFYWHLGDLRAIYKVDEDFTKEQRFTTYSPGPSVSDYISGAWDDFSQHQVAPFGDIPFFLGIGNHETIAPKTRNQFRIAFHRLLDRPELAAQRAEDSRAGSGIPPTGADQTYFHWRERGVDFINLDNASGDAFDEPQLTWLDAVLADDLKNPAVLSIVVGMHEALPYSRSDSHSMCASTDGLRSGLRVYGKLAELKKHKPVYLLASHSHYYLADIYNTPHWTDTASLNGVLPGWLVGTAGAERYPLPTDVSPGADAREHVYGYLLATVDAKGRITFAFHEFAEADLQRTRGEDYKEDAVAFCVANNPPIEVMHAKRSDDHPCERHDGHP